MSNKLAIHGGTPVRTKCFPSQNTMDEKEINAVIRIMKSGRLSGYRANWGKEFWGGPAIQALEAEWQKRFNVKHAIPCNSASSGLQIACGAVGLKQGDEVICTPYSMTISATAPLIWGATPVFADIEPWLYCLSPESVEERITPDTKAIIATSIFGQVYDPRINAIAKKHNLMVIEDAAQAIGSFYKQWHFISQDDDGKLEKAEFKYAGTMGDIGIFSFNYGKHITAGEGGMIVTDNDDLALRCRLIMNHSESVLNDMQLANDKQYDILSDMKHIPGFNMRLGELQAVIISEQLKKFDKLLTQRLDNVQVLKEGLEQIPAITFSPTRENCTHSYYCCTFQWNSELANDLHRDTFINAVKCELPPRIHRESEDVQIGAGYVKPIFLMPIFNKERGLCPVCEDLWENKLFLTLYHAPNSTPFDMKDVVDAFFKVWEYRNEFKK